MIQPISLNYNNRINLPTRMHSGKPARKVNFGAIHIKEISRNFAPIGSDIVRETTRFVNSGMGVKKLGQGLFSEAFEFLKLPNIVIKRSIRGGDSFTQEFQALQAVPETLKDSQHFVARVYDDETYKYYLLSTKVQGKDPNPDYNPWKGLHLRNLFSGMFEMDKVGLYHGDLNNGNIKLTNDGKVNFLDFQWGTVTNQVNFFEQNKKQCHPNFMFIQNAQMFEMAEVPYYLIKINSPADGKRFFRTYLQEKAKYHAARVNFMEKITANWPYSSELAAIRRGISFEKAQAQVYKAPDESILALEAKKVQFLSSFREASKYLDPNTPSKNIISAPSSYLIALNNVQMLRREIVRQQKQMRNSTVNEAYLKGLKEFADYWYDNLEDWTYDAFYYPYRHTQNKLKNWETLHNFADPNVDIEYFEPMWNVVKNVDKRYEPVYSTNFAIKTSANKSCMDDVKAYSNVYPSFGFSEETRETNKMIKDLRKAQKKLQTAYDENKALDVINHGLLLARRAYELAMKKYKNSEMTEYYQNNYLMSKSAELAENVFREVYSAVRKNSPEYTFITGYQNMQKFS